MVRDLESLIEYLYLRATRSDLLEKNLIVNPTSSDNVFGRICIINKVYDIPDLRTADFVIDRRKDLYETGRNPYIRGVDIYQDDVFVMPIKNIFYFGKVPGSLLNYGECYKYLNSQLVDSIKALPI